MKIVFHVGFGKTGTTALQKALFLSKSVLEERGIIYPKLENHPSHRLLCTIAKPYRARPRAMDFWTEDAWDDGKNKTRSTLERAKQKKPQCIILSTEYAIDFSHDGHRNVAAELSRISNNIETVVYLRDPVEYYRSYARQKLKKVGRSGRDRCPPDPKTFSPRFRDKVNRLRCRWPKVILKKYTEGMDIVDDFARSFIGDDITLTGASARENVTHEVEHIPSQVRDDLEISCQDDFRFLKEEFAND